MAKIAFFDKFLDLLKTLSDEEQEILIEIIERLKTERRRTEIANNIAQAKEDYQRGQVFRGSVDDVRRELSEGGC